MTQTYQPRIVKEIWTPHNNGEIAFASPAVGPNTYRENGAQILRNGLLVPTGDYTASLLHSAYCSSAKDEPEFKDVRDKMKARWFDVFNKNVWNSNGVYVFQDLEAVGRSQPLDVKDLEKALKGGKEISGVRFSRDKRVRFAPKGSYTLEYQTPEALAKNGFMIASCDVEGAEKMGEVSSKFSNKPYVYGLNIEEGQAPEQRVSAVNDNDDRLRFYGNYFGVIIGFAFGVLRGRRKGRKIKWHQ